LQKHFKRLIDITSTLKRKSVFVLGPRQTGKSTWLKEAYPKSLFINLLDIEVLREINRDSKTLELKILSYLKKSQDKFPLIIIDEIQKMPELLNLVHKMIEEHKTIRFILTGSSARKLKRSGINLLGGRAGQFVMRPLTLEEVAESDYGFEELMQYGGLPSIVLSESPKEDLKDYIQIYLYQEIKEEGLVRNFSNFDRFLSFAATTNGEQINYTSLGNDAQLSPRTVQDYYQILEDTLIGIRLRPYSPKVTSRKLSALDKFYFFDVGVANYLRDFRMSPLLNEQRGKALEHLVFCELWSFVSYASAADWKLFYWRTHTKLEVDFILENGALLYAIEVKYGRKPLKNKIHGLLSFHDEFNHSKPIVICDTNLAFTENKISYMNIIDFKKFLWSLR